MKGSSYIPGAIVGVESIAYERNEQGELENFPQLGNVVIEDDAKIGTNDIIAKGVSYLEVPQ